MNTPLPKAVEDLIAAIIRDGLQEDTRSLAMRSRQLASKVRSVSPELAGQISSVLGEASALRSVSRALPIPVDADSRQKLLREQYPVILEAPPILPPEIEKDVATLIREQGCAQTLMSAGLTPIRSLLMTGPPGCGKTTTAGWIAQQLDLPLLTLDLATVMSSYLGKTGSNIRAVLNHAHQVPCILLLDEFDAIAKRRNDDSDVGELKRLVTVLLQAIDEWPTGSVLIAATNHGELLDPAVWRRFDMVVDFPAPTKQQIARLISTAFDPVISSWLSGQVEPESLAALKLVIKGIKKKAFLEERPVFDVVVEQFAPDEDLQQLQSAIRTRLVLDYADRGGSQRKISTETGLTRPQVKRILDEHGR